MTQRSGDDPNRTAAFFDVDGTIADTTIAHYLRFFMLRRLSPWRGRLWHAWFLAKCLYYLLLDRVDRSRLNVVFYQNYRGLPADEIKRLAEDCFRDVLRPRMYEDAISCIEDHRRAGRLIVLVTGSLDFIMRPLAREIRADALLAAVLQESNGRFTGDLTGPPVGELEKARLMKEFAANEGINLADSHAFADGISDVPMLDAVGFAHIVNPGKRLSKLARLRGWPVLKWGHTTQ